MFFFSALFNYEEDVAKYTIKVANDPRTCNKIVIYKMQKNILSQIELISLWEKKTGKSVKKVHVAEEELVKQTESKFLKCCSILLSEFESRTCWMNNNWELFDEMQPYHFRIMYEHRFFTLYL